MSPVGANIEKHVKALLTAKLMSNIKAAPSSSKSEVHEFFYTSLQSDDSIQLVTTRACSKESHSSAMAVPSACLQFSASSTEFLVSDGRYRLSLVVVSASAAYSP